MPRSYSGASRIGKEGLEVTFKNNRQYIENLKKVIGAVGKKAYGEFIAHAMNNAVKATFKDSGRAAANWNISFGSVPAQSGMDPSRYGQQFNGGPGSVGNRYDAGTGNADTIVYYKGFHYGYIDEGGGSLELKKDGRIYRQLKIGEFSNPPAAYVYNPVFDVQYGSYPDNAFKSALRGVQQTVGADAVDPITERVIASKIPRLIRETAKELNFPLTRRK